VRSVVFIGFNLGVDGKKSIGGQCQFSVDEWPLASRLKTFSSSLRRCDSEFARPPHFGEISERDTNYTAHFLSICLPRVHHRLTKFGA
jgi:hypothetical protein